MSPRSSSAATRPASRSSWSTPRPAGSYSTSDAVHLYEELEYARPFGVLADLEEMYVGFETIKRLGAEPGTTVVPGHDPEVTRRFPAVAGAPEGVALQLA